MAFRIALLILFVTTLAGCQPGKSASKPPAVKSPPLTVCVVGDEGLAASIRRELAARNDEPIQVDVLTHDEFYHAKRIRQDVLIYPPAMMGELIEREWIIPLPKATLQIETLNIDDVALGIRETECCWGRTPYALPLGSPVLMLMVRTDLLKQFDLDIPKTWREYAAAVKKIHESDFLTQNNTVAAATLEPLDESYLASLWLARSAAYVQHNENLSTYFDYQTGDARIDTPGFTRAAKELAEIAATIPDDFNSLTPQSTTDAFMAGKSVMALGWVDKQTLVPNTVPEDIEFALIPGSTETYQVGSDKWVPNRDDKVVSVPLLSTSGMVGSISVNSSQSVKAANLLAMLTSPDVIPLVSPASRRTTLCRASSLPLAANWMPPALPGTSMRQYAQICLNQLQSPGRLSSLRIPNREAYRTAAAEALRKTMQAGEAEIETIWQEAAKKWDELSEKQGKSKQLKAFRNSNGNE
ncbi:extracellular solute-binding protein [bacterium]|nr:extracellular solute-binding protein [bacterium]